MNNKKRRDAAKEAAYREIDQMATCPVCGKSIAGTFTNRILTHAFINT